MTNRGSSTPALELRGACFKTARGTSTKPLELALQPGELVLLVGPAGSGKSEILRCVTGLSEPLSGEIRTHGRLTNGLHHDAWMEVRTQLAYASESAPLMANTDVMTNLILPLALRGMVEDTARQNVLAALHRFSMDHIADLRPHQISRDDHRKVLLIRAWLLPVSLLLLDEPPRDTDRQKGNRWRHALEERRAEGCAILATAADPSQWSGGVTRMVSVVDSGEPI